MWGSYTEQSPQHSEHLVCFDPLRPHSPGGLGAGLGQPGDPCTVELSPDKNKTNRVNIAWRGRESPQGLGEQAQFQLQHDGVPPKPNFKKRPMGGSAG